MPASDLGQTQHQSPPSQEGEPESEIACRLSHTQLAIIEVEVTDQYGEYVSNLKHEDFIVHENGERQEIGFFLEEKYTDEDEARIVYLVGYWPKHKGQDGQLKIINVQVRNVSSPGFTIKFWPEGYFALIDE